MPGIGVRLQRMLDRESLAGTLGAYLTGVAVTSAPWLLTTAVLLSLRITARAESSSFLVVEQVVTLVYALTVILSAPIHVVVARYTADRLYDQHLERIGAPLWRALTLTLLGFLAVGVALAVAMRLPLPVAIAGALLTAIVGAQALLLSVAGALTSPLIVLRAFCAGAPLGILASLWFYRGLHLGAVGYLAGFAGGQLITLILLLRGIARLVPAETDEKARLLPAFREYWLLALSSLVYYLSIWTDKALVWALAGLDAASSYSAVSAIAWFSVVPTFGWMYVQIETRFYRLFRGYYGGLNSGAPLAQLRQRAAKVTDEAMRILRGAALVQGTMLALAVLGAPGVMRVAALPESSVAVFRFAALGASLQLMSLLEILLLYYFDLRREALAVALTLFAAELALVTGAYALGLPGAAGYALAGAVAAATGLWIVRSRLATLVGDTFQTQPYGNAV